MLLKARREQLQAAAGESIATPSFTRTRPNAPIAAGAAGSQGIANGGRSATVAAATASPPGRITGWFIMHTTDLWRNLVRRERFSYQEAERPALTFSVPRGLSKRSAAAPGGRLH